MSLCETCYKEHDTSRCEMCENLVCGNCVFELIDQKYRFVCEDCFNEYFRDGSEST